MNKSRVVVIVEDGVVKQVLTNHEDIQVLVLDRDVGGCEANIMFEAAGESNALDALEQALPEVDAASVEAAYCDFESHLKPRLANDGDIFIGKERFRRLLHKWFA